MLQYKIPQNVGIADKIVGPFSLRQLIIVAIGTGISYVLFALSSKLYELNFIEYFVIALPLLIAFAAALVKINNVTFTKFLMLLLEFSIKPKKRKWDHRGIINVIDLDTDTEKDTKESVTSDTKAKKNLNLNDITRILDSGGFDHLEEIEHKDIDDAEDEHLMLEAFFGHKTDERGEKSTYLKTAKDKEAYKRKLKYLSRLPRTELLALREVKEEISEIKAAQKALHNLPPVSEKEREAGGMDPKKSIDISKPAVSEAPSKVTPKQEVKLKKPEEIQNKGFKKKRPRRKKPKIQKPVRPETRIDNTQKKQPVKLINNNQRPVSVKQIKSKAAEYKSPPPQKKEPPAAKKKEGEINMENLKGGGVIEFNLDN